VFLNSRKKEKASLILKTTKNSKIPKFEKKKKEIVFLVGFPGCGKSTLANAQYQDYRKISLDEEKSKSKFLKSVKSAINYELNIVVDNTNLNPDNRNEIIKMGASESYYLRCIYFNIDIDTCKYLAKLRVQLSKGQMKPIPEIAYRALKKNFRVPTLKEGFDKIHEIKEISIKSKFLF
jgi:bifunctional polynucleotide phosphatase/kinase